MRHLAFLLLSSALAGCAVIERPAPLAQQEIVALARSGRPAAEIVEELRRTRTVHSLAASDILRLAEAGVPREALDYLQSAQLEEITWHARSPWACCAPLYRGSAPCPWPPRGPWPPAGRSPWTCH